MVGRQELNDIVSLGIHKHERKHGNLFELIPELRHLGFQRLELFLVEAEEALGVESNHCFPNFVVDRLRIGSKRISLLQNIKERLMVRMLILNTLVNHAPLCKHLEFYLSQVVVETVEF